MGTHPDIHHAATTHQALPSNSPVELIIEYGQLNRFFSDYVQNIGQGGTFVRTEQPFDIGTRFDFVLRVPELEAPIKLHGRVQWNLYPKQCKPGQEPGMGIGFVYTSELDRQRLIARVERLMVNSLGPVLYEHLVGRHLSSIE